MGEKFRRDIQDIMVRFSKEQDANFAKQDARFDQKFANQTAEIKRLIKDNKNQQKTSNYSMLFSGWNMRILIIVLVLTLSLSTVSFAQKKPDDKQYSLHLYYKEVMYNKSFSEIFGEVLLMSIVAGISGLAMGSVSYSFGGNFNTGFAVGTMTSLSDQTSEIAIIPFTDRHIYAFGRCFVGESITYATDVKFCDRSFIIAKYEETEDVVAQFTMGHQKIEAYYKDKEHIACRDWALELHKRKLNDCKEYTSHSQMRYLTAVVNRIEDEQKNPNKYWDKDDIYSIIDNK